MKSLKKKIEPTNINNQLQRFLFDHKVSTHSTTNATLASLLLSRTIRTQFYSLRPNIRYTVNKKQALMEKQTCERYRHFGVGKNVLVRNYNGTKWIKTTVKKQIGNVIYIVELRNGKLWKTYRSNNRRQD